jgi:hypothetical protein
MSLLAANRDALQNVPKDASSTLAPSTGLAVGFGPRATLDRGVPRSFTPKVRVPRSRLLGIKRGFATNNKDTAGTSKVPTNSAISNTAGLTRTIAAS